MSDTHQYCQLIGQQRQPLLLLEHAHRYQLSKKAEIHPVLARIAYLKHTCKHINLLHLNKPWDFVCVFWVFNQ